MKLLIVFPFLISMISLIACKDEDTPVEPVSKYLACCGVEPVEFVQDSYYVYVPNCFSPDGDAINDFFIPSVSDNIIGISSYEIYSSENNSNELIYSSSLASYYS